MDEVRVERWEKRYKERTLEVMIKYWPDTDKYKDRPELIASLEHQVWISRPFPSVLALHAFFILFYFIRTSKFWPSFVLAQFEPQLFSNCSCFHRVSYRRKHVDIESK